MPYVELTAKSDVIIVGHIEGMTLSRLKTESITYNLYKVRVLYTLKGCIEDDTIMVGTPNNMTSLHYDLNQWGDEVLLLLQGEGRAYLPFTPQAVIGININHEYLKSNKAETGSDLLKGISISTPMADEDDVRLITEYISSIDSVNVPAKTGAGGLRPILILLAALVLPALLLIVIYGFSQKVINICLYPHVRIVEMETADGLWSMEWYEELPREPVIIPSPFGYSLSAEYIPADNKLKSKADGILGAGEALSAIDRTVIICHGVTVSRVASIKYVKLFRSLGFNCLIYDNRRHGQSGGRFTSYGFYEKHDLKAVVDWFRENKGKNHILGLHGESMGAAIILQYGGMEDTADFYIADCPYSSFWEQLLYRLRVEFRLPSFPLMDLVRLMIRLRAGFDLKAVRPIDGVRHIEKPVLFIHGLDDDYILPAMSQAMYDAKKGPKAIYLVPGAPHARSLAADYEKYHEVAAGFIREYVFKR